MTQKRKTAISPTRAEDYPEWYQQVIKAADLAEHSPVRGCMIIKPWGYALWENIQRVLDDKFKKTGHQNAYFPLFIPLSYFEKEAKHVEGFAKECAVVTHHRLTQDSEGRLIPDGKLEEPLIVRPTSEMVVGEAFSRWVQSYRDLPLLINQWANVVRWEMRTRLFLRTAEFLWQEGHTAHATSEEAEEEALKMLGVYADFAKEFLAMPVIRGRKTELEKFPGAEITYTIEAMMQDGKALQGGTSHFLGQNFAKSCNIQFQSEKGELEYAWTTSWGVTTRLIGGMLMTHSDDDGLVIPPRIAPLHLVILPIAHKEEGRAELLDYVDRLKKACEQLSYHEGKVRVSVDERDLRGGEKNWHWIKKGVPLRLEIGQRECAAGLVSYARRDLPHKETRQLSKEDFLNQLTFILDEIQSHLLKKAERMYRERTSVIHTPEEFWEFFKERGGDHPQGGFALAPFSCDPILEKKIQSEGNISVRCIPIDQEKIEERCIFTGQLVHQRVIFAKSY